MKKLLKKLSHYFIPVILVILMVGCQTVQPEPLSSQTSSLEAPSSETSLAEKPIPETVSSKSLTDPVMTQSGLVSGVYNSDQSVQSFLGIPYAAPPVGDLRWKAPQEPESWDDVRVCDKFGSVATQYADPSQMLAGVMPDSEDCLYMNIYTPAKMSDENLPVFIYFHGGGWTAASGMFFDGTKLAQKGIIVVTINYRLATFGALALPELTQESEYNSSGNYHILDMIQSLKWLQNNITNFGGDPDNVTISGQSAGAHSTNIIVSSPLAKGLFNKVILNSGAASMNSALREFESLDDAEAAGTAYMEALGADSLEELRAMSTEELSSVALPDYSPIIDGYVLPETVSNIYNKGEQSIVPMLVGFTRDEQVANTFPTAAEFVSESQAKYGDFIDEFLEVYPANTDEEAKWSSIWLTADTRYAWHMYALAREQGKKADTYLYYFNYQNENSEYVRHSDEVYYIFGLSDEPDADALSLSENIANYWVNFIKTGNPNGDSLPEWTKFTDAPNQIMELGNNLGMIENPRLGKFQFLDTYLESLK